MLALRMGLALLLVISVGGKIAISNQSPRVADATMGKTATVELAAFLNRQGFRVESDWPESPFVSATAGDCRITALVAAPQGWHRNILRQTASGTDQVLFVYGNTIYQDQPVWLTWTDYYWSLLNRYVGRKLPIRPVLGILALQTCNLHDIPWVEFQKRG